MNSSVNVKRLQKQFGLTIRAKRQKMKLSQEAFADNAGIHRTYVSAIELGKVDVGIGVAFKLASALNTPLSKLIKNAEDHSPAIAPKS